MRKLSEQYFVSPQIEASDIPAIAAAGIKTVICNRPDAENPPSHYADVMRSAAEAAGLAFEYFPIGHSTMTPAAFAQQIALVEVGQPVLAYCASGTRCTVAWLAGMAALGHDVDEMLQAARDAGYALDHLRPSLIQAGTT